MGKLNGAVDFTGSLNNISAYKAKGIDGTIVRMKGGASKEQVNSSPNFVNTRRNNAEFGGASKMGTAIRQGLDMIAGLGDYNYTGKLNGLMKVILTEGDKVNEWGKRSVLLSEQRHLLQGFNFNKYHTFNSIVHGGVQCTINRAACTAMLELPAMAPAINFTVPWKMPLYQWHAVMALVPDMVYTPNGYAPAAATEGSCKVHASSGWLLTAQAAEAFTMPLELPVTAPLHESFTVVVGIGISFGSPVTDHYIQPEKYKCCGKIIAVG